MTEALDLPTFLLGPWLQPLPQMMKRTNVMEGMRAVGSLYLKYASQGQLAGKGREGEVQDASGRHGIPPDWYRQPSSLVSRGAERCVWWSLGVAGSRARLTDDAWGRWGDGRRGDGCQARRMRR